MDLPTDPVGRAAPQPLCWKKAVFGPISLEFGMDLLKLAWLRDRGSVVGDFTENSSLGHLCAWQSPSMG